MNIQNLFSVIEKSDPEIYDRLDTRRDVMRKFARTSGRVALAAIPFALGSMLQKAQAAPPPPTGESIPEVLNFALTLEYLESNFYNKAVDSGIFPDGASKAAFTVIRDHENAHVKFLKTAITAAGFTPVSFKFSDFDFTAKGTFPGVFTDYGTMLAVAQTFEDTGVRAYKGQAPYLMSNNDYLTAALQIHSVEGRHAAHLRYMRKKANLLIPAGVDVMPWITLDQSGIASPAVQASYDGEQNVTQGGVPITNIGGFDISAAAASESFDEPLTKDQVMKIVSPFFA